jgi:prepilin-type N-terminal cleavage/methylation domain-containing protein
MNMKKRSRSKGFTLAELLIVVAIISVLVAVSVPIFTNQLKKSRLATNQANARAAKSAVLTTWMTEKYSYGEYEGETVEGHVFYKYDPSTGEVENIAEIEGHRADPVGVTDPTDYSTAVTNIAEWTVDTPVGESDTLGSKVYSKCWFLDIDANGDVYTYYVEY